MIQQKINLLITKISIISWQVAQIASNAERQGLAEYIVAHVQDATKSATVEDAFGDGENLTPPFYEGSFSRIMLDAPCSALGKLGIDSLTFVISLNSKGKDKSSVRARLPEFLS